MNIEELLNELYETEVSRVELLLIEEAGAVLIGGFSDVGSWRGYYNEPALFMGDNHDKYDLIALLDELTDTTYKGWKGGEYTYTSDQNLVIETEHRAYSGDGYISHVAHITNQECLQIICIKD